MQCLLSAAIRSAASAATILRRQSSLAWRNRAPSLVPIAPMPSSQPSTPFPAWPLLRKRQLELWRAAQGRYSLRHLAPGSAHQAGWAHRVRMAAAPKGGLPLVLRSAPRCSVELLAPTGISNGWTSGSTPTHVARGRVSRTRTSMGFAREDGRKSLGRRVVLAAASPGNGTAAEAAPRQCVLDDQTLNGRLWTKARSIIDAARAHWALKV